MSYLLKIYDTPLVEFDFTRDTMGMYSFQILRVFSSMDRMPYPMAVAGITPNSLYAWLQSRVAPSNRRFIGDVYRQMGINPGDIKGIIDVTHCLSLNDSYWVTKSNSKMLFKDYNLFDNKIDEVLSLVAYTGHTESEKHKVGLTSEWTTDGSFPKAWRRINGETYLYKSGNYVPGFPEDMSPYSEFFASQILDIMGLRHVPYTLHKWKGHLASVCPLFNTKDVSYVPFHRVFNVSSPWDVLRNASSIGEGVFEDIRSMYIFDILVANGDRHMLNFGFLRDNRTGRLIGTAPIFDNNAALFPGYSDLQPIREASIEDIMTNSYWFWPKNSPVNAKTMASLLITKYDKVRIRGVLETNLRNDKMYRIDAQRLSDLNNFIHRSARFLIHLPSNSLEEVENRLFGRS
jgi:hypothetical protein